jgi:hypothetical protein
MVGIIYLMLAIYQKKTPYRCGLVYQLKSEQLKEWIKEAK